MGGLFGKPVKRLFTIFFTFRFNRPDFLEMDQRKEEREGQPFGQHFRPSRSSMEHHRSLPLRRFPWDLVAYQDFEDSGVNALARAPYSLHRTYYFFGSQLPTWPGEQHLNPRPDAPTREGTIGAALPPRLATLTPKVSGISQYSCTPVGCV